MTSGIIISFWADASSASYQAQLKKTLYYADFQAKGLLLTEGVITVPDKDGQTVLDVLREAKLVSSNSDAYRMIKQNAVRLDGEKLDDARVAFPHPGVLQVGKRKFVRVI